jgi:hypothetical protein
VTYAVRVGERWAAWSVGDPFGWDDAMVVDEPDRFVTDARWRAVELAREVGLDKAVVVEVDDV